MIEKRLYNSPIGYSENHHIIPKCIGGGDEESNMVSLTLREHYICHKLLTKFIENDGIMFAFLGMSQFHRIDIGSKYYEKCRIKNTKIVSKRFKKLWKDPIYREKMVSMMKKRWDNLSPIDKKIGIGK